MMSFLQTHKVRKASSIAARIEENGDGDETRAIRTRTREYVNEKPGFRVAMDSFDALMFEFKANVPTFVLFLATRPDRALMIRHVDGLVDRWPKLRCVPKLGPHPEWVELPSVRGRDHVQFIHLPNARSTDDYLCALADLKPDFRDGQPPWTWVVCEGHADADPPAAIYFYWHHALADGRAALAVLHDNPRSASDLCVADDPKDGQASPLVTVIAMAVYGLATVASLLLAPRAFPKVGDRRAYDALSIPRNALRRLASDLGCETDAAICVIVQAASSALKADTGGKRHSKTTMLVPINDRRSMARGDLANTVLAMFIWGNGEINRATATRMRGTMRWQRRVLGSLVNKVLHACIRIEIRLRNRLPDRLYARMMRARFAGIDTLCTIVPGPARPVHIGGVGVREAVGFAPLLPGSDCSFAIGTYAQTVLFCVTRDSDSVPSIEPVRAVLESVFGRSNVTVTSSQGKR